MAVIVASRPWLVHAWCLVTFMAMWLCNPSSIHAKSQLGGVKKMVYASEFGFAIAGPSDWYGTMQAQGPMGKLAYPEWRPTLRAVYVKYGEEEAVRQPFNPMLIIEMMDAEGKPALDYLARNLEANRAEPGISVVEAPAERTVGGRKWATCRLRTSLAGEDGEVVVIQQWYATVHEPVLLLIVGGSTEKEFSKDVALFEQTIETATFSGNAGDAIIQQLAQPKRSHGD